MSPIRSPKISVSIALGGKLFDGGVQRVHKISIAKKKPRSGGVSSARGRVQIGDLKSASYRGLSAPQWIQAATPHE